MVYLWGMEMISLKEYLKYSIDNKLVLKLNWVISMFSVLMESTDYCKLERGKIYVVADGKLVELEGGVINKPIINPEDKITLEAGYIENISEVVETTVGRLLLNYVLIAYNFNSKVPFQNKRFEVSDIENKYITTLLRDDDELTDEFISVDEYVKFVDAATYLQNWAEVISASATEKSMIPPDGIKEKKKELIEKAIREHGPDALKDYAIIANIESELKRYDKEFLKDDPSFGKLLEGKILNNSRKKLFLMGGAERNFSSPDEDALLIEDTLEDGLENDPVKLASHYNSIRFASYSRGTETFKGGLTAKILLRATSAIVIRGEDCGTKGFKNWTVNANNYKSIVGRYIITSSGTVLVNTINDAKVYIGKTVKMRSPLYCISDGESICKTCAGKGLSSNENSVPLIIANIGAIILNLSMKAMHDTTIKTVELDLSDMLS